ncbi:MAG: isoprenyl transferase [Terrisporobacter othiniensis]|uniref:Isoprenyl transferase n=2 Tax=Terrisporobacter TaxID=1505652 RepID=A0AAX2ZGK1_9FIRM|nr:MULTISPECIES: isoprenyl transferase [Terrisporobacter]MBN9647489.1 isoprenyl transferase [Terrisporobacter glycolicus]MDU4862076.1 isoprenyl transferase [Terrisporobacter othiniensis]MDU6995712.1 isoprenyl transferase [Terrisporobacter othiniensis]UEL48347.1 isoprenyl transferase [Terrisporobacter hibernicus]SFJ32224.1 undecaprenyl diphosphate synthase [Terrisporobacter glycolicus]
MKNNLFYDIDLNRVPKHIAIIMDGNGRWAKSKFLPRAAGHKAGVETIRTVLRECKKLSVKHVTLYAFSTENWKRPKLEVDTLMNLLSTYLKNEVATLHKENVKLTAIGDINNLPNQCVKELNKAIELTKNNTGCNLNLALNYGGRLDIKNALVDIIKDVKVGKINLDEIDENTISNHLSTKSIPDPDLVIRTSGEERLSNFLLWEVAYAEFYFTNVHWPDFDEKELQRAIFTYQNRDRRFGGIK